MNNFIKSKKGFEVNREFSVIGLISDLKQKESGVVENYEYTKESEEENNSLEIIRKQKKISELGEVLLKTVELEQKFIHERDQQNIKK